MASRTLLLVSLPVSGASMGTENDPLKSNIPPNPLDQVSGFFPANNVTPSQIGSSSLNQPHRVSVVKRDYRFSRNSLSTKKGTE